MNSPLRAAWVCLAAALLWIAWTEHRVHNLLHSRHEPGLLCESRRGHNATTNSSNELPIARLPAFFPPATYEGEVKDRLRAIFRRLPPIQALPPNSSVFLTFTNGHYSELMLNSVATLAALPAALPVFVYCFDLAAVELCRDYGIPHFQTDAGRIMDTSDFRQDRAKFLAMGVHKPEMVLRLFREHGVREVILTDTDTIWLRNPATYLARHPTADIFTTTDCLSYEADVYHFSGYHRCAHVRLGSAGWGWGINTGVTVYRNTAAVHPFLEQWRLKMLDPATLKRNLDDQASFMDVLAGQAPAMQHGGVFQRAPEDPRVLLAGPSGAVKTVVLPTVVFPGGKTYFDYHLSQKHGTHPYAIHATFQRYNNAGKRSRFREEGAWLLDGSGYYSRGKFMTINNNVQNFVASLQAHANGTLSQLHVHLLAASYQLAVLRDAYAIARTLGRILVMPRVWAWCDWDPAASVVHACQTSDAEGHLPYQGPTDTYVNIDVMDGTRFVEYREHSFLSHPSVPRHVLWDKETVYFYWPGEREPTRYATGANVAMGPGLNDEQLRASLAALEGTRLLHFENIEPHSFAGFVRSKDNQAFADFYQGMQWEQKWCCLTDNSTHREAGHQHIFYVQPEPFVKGVPAFPWPVPAYQTPPFCSPQHEMPLRREDEPNHRSIWDSPLHPCVYFETAAAQAVPRLWTRQVSQQTLPVRTTEAWSPFLVPGDSVPWQHDTVMELNQQLASKTIRL